jgi:pimeloyl-ACP methyl ester carboxylesterase
MTMDLSAKWNLPNVFDFEGQDVRWGVAGEGPPLVFVHGTPFNSVVWRRIIPYVVSRRRAYFYDLLGYGQSEMREGQNVSLGIQSKVLAALLEHWELGAPDVVAHDFGGATVLRAHLLDGKNYRSLFMIDPLAIAPWGSPLPVHARRHQAAFAELPAYVHRAIVPAYIAEAIHKPLRPEAMALYAEPWFTERGQPAFWRQIAQFDEKYTDEVEPNYNQVRCPVMILWGEEDRLISVKDGHRLASMIPGSTLKIIPGSGHIVQEDAPEAVVSALLEFLPIIP